MQLYTSVAIILYMIFAIIGGMAADFFGRKIVTSIAFVVLFAITVMMIVTIAHGESSPALFFASNIALPFFTMPALAFLKQSIPIVIRYRIFSLAHAIGSICISAPTAFFSTLMYHKTKLAWLPITYFLTTIVMIAFCVNILCKKYGANKY
jgi:MFS family permease